MRISDWSSDVCSSDLEDDERGKTDAPPSKFKEQAAGQQGCHPQCRCEAGHANTGSVGLSDHDVKWEAEHPDHRNAGCQQVDDAAIGEIEAHSRSDERRVWRECVSTCRYRGGAYNS